MEPITIREILEATGGRLLGCQTDTERVVTGVDTDSRKIQPGSLFVPLPGEHVDGHSFIANALKAGAAACLTTRTIKTCSADKSFILVSDARKALRDLSVYYKRRFDIPFIAVTGSVGKTTAKDMIAAVLSQKYEVLKTDGNFNSDIGLPLTLFRLERRHTIAVLEMGMSKPGEIDYLSAIVEPDAAVITNIGDAHIEYFGSREKILAAKSEVFNHMKPGGLAVLNHDDPLLRTLEPSLPYPICWCGETEDAAYRAYDIRSDGEKSLWCKLKTPGLSMAVEVGALGRYMIYPILYAAALGEHFGLNAGQIRQGIADFIPTKMRMNILHRSRGITILDDSYNANPQSMRAAVQVLAGTRGSYKIAVLGDMLELGSLAPALHEGIGVAVAENKIDCLIAIGEIASHIASAADKYGISEVFYCLSIEDALPVLESVVRDNCTVLVKASRGMRFELVTEYLKSITQDQ